MLKDIYFACKKGDFVAVVGKSGSGKSSFLNALANFIPYQGKVIVPDRIGYIFQSHSLFPWMTVQQNIAFGLGQLSRVAKEKKVTDLLERIDLTVAKNKYPTQLSGGRCSE